MDFTRNLNLRINAELTPAARTVVGLLQGGLTNHGQYATDGSGSAANERVRQEQQVQIQTFGQKAAAVWETVQGGVAKAYQWTRRFLLGVSIAMYALQMVTRPIDDLLKRVEQLGLSALRTFENWGKAALKAAADMQTLQLRTMAIFGGQGEQGFGWLMKFTVGMPFQIKQLGEAFNMLGVYGTNSLVDIKRAMKDVADTAAALEREPKDVAMGLALGAEGAQGGSRRLRQMGITPQELQAGIDEEEANGRFLNGNPYRRSA